MRCNACYITTVRSSVRSGFNEIKQIKGYTSRASAFATRYIWASRNSPAITLSKDVHYDRQARHVDLRASLSDQEMTWALAEVLHQVFGIQNLLPLLLESLIADPPGAARMLDRNHIKPLPPEIPPVPIDDRPATPFKPGVETADPADRINVAGFFERSGPSPTLPGRTEDISAERSQWQSYSCRRHEWSWIISAQYTAWNNRQVCLPTQTQRGPQRRLYGRHGVIRAQQG